MKVSSQSRAHYTKNWGEGDTLLGIGDMMRHTPSNASNRLGKHNRFVHCHRVRHVGTCSEPNGQLVPIGMLVSMPS